MFHLNKACKSFGIFCAVRHTDFQIAAHSDLSGQAGDGNLLTESLHGGLIELPVAGGNHQFQQTFWMPSRVVERNEAATCDAHKVKRRQLQVIDQGL